MKTPDEIRASMLSVVAMKADNERMMEALRWAYGALFRIKRECGDWEGGYALIYAMAETASTKIFDATDGKAAKEK